MPQSAYAHEEEEAGGVSAVLHIDPNDNPVAGIPLKFFLEFKDIHSEFNVHDCDCQAVIKKDGETVAQNALSEPTSIFNFSTKPIIEATLPEGKYDLIFMAHPKTDAKFEPFELDYDFAVSATGKPGSDHHFFHSEHIGHILIFGGGFVVIIGWLIRDKIREIKKNKTKQKEPSQD